MELIIKIPDEDYKYICKIAKDLKGRAVLPTDWKAVANGTPYNPTGDCISREAVRSKIWKERVDKDEGCNSEYIRGLKTAIGFINNAQAVDIKDQIAGAYNEGYMCGNKEAEKARPQGEYVDISKLRLMTVEECAGHTIEYAMGWKACIEWIKKGGAECGHL